MCSGGDILYTDNKVSITGPQPWDVMCKIKHHPECILLPTTLGNVPVVPRYYCWERSHNNSPVSGWYGGEFKKGTVSRHASWWLFVIVFARIVFDTHSSGQGFTQDHIYLHTSGMEFARSLLVHRSQYRIVFVTRPHLRQIFKGCCLGLITRKTGANSTSNLWPNSVVDRTLWLGAKTHKLYPRQALDQLTRILTLSLQGSTRPISEKDLMSELKASVEASDELTSTTGRDTSTTRYR